MYGPTNPNEINFILQIKYFSVVKITGFLIGSFQVCISARLFCFADSADDLNLIYLG